MCHISGTDRATDLLFSPYVLEFLGVKLHDLKRANFATSFFTLYSEWIYCNTIQYNKSLYSEALDFVITDIEEV